MQNDKRLLFLINWKEEGEWDLYRSIRDRWRQITFLQPYRISPSIRSRFNRFSMWLSEIYLPFVSLGRRYECDVIISWSMRTGVCLGILNRFLRSRARPLHTMYDFHINLRKGDACYRGKLQILKWAMGGIDFFFTTSNPEADIYTDLFQIPRERIVFLPMAPPRHYLTHYGFPRRDYVFSYGNSGRDYPSLIRAAEETRIPTVILTQAYRPARPLPSNVTLIRKKTVGLDLIRWIVSARIVVLPLQDVLVSAGQTAMLETMALGRPLIVSMNMATAEYAHHGKDAMFYAPRDAGALKEQMLFLWNHPEEAERLGRRARESAHEYPDRHVRVFLDTLGRLLSSKMVRPAL